MTKTEEDIPVPGYKFNGNFNQNPAKDDIFIVFWSLDQTCLFVPERKWLLE
jgi:hypothetical protein